VRDEGRGLSGGQKKLVELGRVLMLDPRCILLDEPFAGVNPVLIEEICERVRELQRQGIAFIVIEHHLQALVIVATHDRDGPGPHPGRGRPAHRAGRPARAGSLYGRVV
jgi:ABC-type branched-subunit amino acid transport system ATPase component